MLNLRLRVILKHTSFSRTTKRKYSVWKKVLYELFTNALTLCMLQVGRQRSARALQLRRGSSLCSSDLREKADVWPKSIRDKVGSALSLTLVFSFNGTWEWSFCTRISCFAFLSSLSPFYSMFFIYTMLFSHEVQFLRVPWGPWNGESEFFKSLSRLYSSHFLITY